MVSYLLHGSLFLCMYVCSASFNFAEHTQRQHLVYTAVDHSDISYLYPAMFIRSLGFIVIHFLHSLTKTVRHSCMSCYLTHNWETTFYFILCSRIFVQKTNITSSNLIWNQQANFQVQPSNQLHTLIWDLHRHSSNISECYQSNQKRFSIILTN